MDKTYAETQGKAPFDWNQFLANPPELNSNAHHEAIAMAKDWVTCACGNQCAIIERADQHTPERYKHAPVDQQLNDWGARFYDEVALARWPEARRLLRKIEARSAVMIAQELAKLNAQ